jgi:hypothetical protein
VVAIGEAPRPARIAFLKSSDCFFHFAFFFFAFFFDFRGFRVATWESLTPASSSIFFLRTAAESNFLRLFLFPALAQMRACRSSVVALNVRLHVQHFSSCCGGPLAATSGIGALTATGAEAAATAGAATAAAATATSAAAGSGAALYSCSRARAAPREEGRADRAGAAAGGAAVSTAATGDAAGDAEVLMSCFFAAGASVVEGDERFVAEVIKLLDISISQLCKISRYSRRGYISKLEQ